ncbi:acetyl-CoA carboxylase biotin carboxyl carrier protein subunit [Erysipelothrix sp. HDW6A]|uniref:biotin/lipoyl-containing protein n=1 Tax=Erysipelothrix sp. HDW6A TaxID=2714928 RepID=UPI00140B9ABD|nr:biotin/lipoyl-containing protein [Erysipelothrix sp. HDW6A]QIK56934.1 acetyl-CoA carboxylase biotin carboxyl carrier protein subunit [Erysipelothrix sp. HDW6A]
MLRKFRIKLNDKEYVVEMEEIGAPQVAPQAAPIQQAAPAPVQEAPAPAPQAAPQTNMDVTGGTEVSAPMPGNILDVVVKVGDTVAVNQNLLVLEAMKMENNIVAPIAGTVVAVNVTKGENIDVGTVMVVIK